MKAQVRKKLQRAGFGVIRKYSITRGGKQIKVICKVTEDGKLRTLERYDTKEQRNAAFEKMLESETLIAG